MSGSCSHGPIGHLGSIKNIHLSYFRNLKFVFSVLICCSSVFYILALGSARTAPPVSVRVRVRVRVSVSFSFTVLCLQLWRCMFLMCPGHLSVITSYQAYSHVSELKYYTIIVTTTTTTT